MNNALFLRGSFSCRLLLDFLLLLRYSEHSINSQSPAAARRVSLSMEVSALESATDTRSYNGSFLLPASIGQSAGTSVFLFCEH